MNDMVSIITPSYNTGMWISETIESVLKQTYTNWEMIIVDDCSTDNTDEIVGKYLDDKRIKYIKNEHNRGAAFSRNRALREAKGSYIAFLDSDDLWIPKKLEKQLKFMKENGYAFTCAYSECIDEKSESLNKISISPKRISKAMMYAYCWVYCLTVMYYVPVVGLIQIEDIEKRNDYSIWLKAIDKTNCYCYPEVLGRYRVRSTSLSNVSKYKLIPYHYKLFRKSLHMNPIASTLLTAVNIVMAVIKKIFLIKKIKYL